MDKLVNHIRSLAAEIERPVQLMEVCGTHTVAIFRHGIRDILPDTIKLISGPGCPVCVTSVEDIDRAVALAMRDDVILATFGDMMRVPGSNKSLLDARADGASIQIVYSPMESLDLALSSPGKKIIFFATGFETTSPSVAATLHTAVEKGPGNFFIYSVHKIIPPALRILASHPDIRIDGFLLPGHVSTIIGSAAYTFLSDEYRTPSVIAGFNADDILQSIFMLLRQIKTGIPEVQVQYTDVVRREGNPKAMEFLDMYFEPDDAEWRGIGKIEKSGLTIKNEFSAFNARKSVTVDVPTALKPSACKCGDVLIGKISPDQCPLFGRSCTPDRPVGACMVSMEGSCAAYFRYGGNIWKK